MSQRLIKEIEVDSFTNDIWAFTSHANLCFTMIDGYTEPIIRVGVLQNEQYRIDYSLPPNPITTTQELHTKLNRTLKETILDLQSILLTWKDIRNNERGEESQ
jgi:hypothetical protein